MEDLDMLSHSIKVALLASTVLGCGYVAPGMAAADEKAVASIVAHLALADGTTLQFQEDPAGGLAVAAQGRAKAKSGLGREAMNGVGVDKAMRLSPVELYKAVTGGSEAPAALVAAQARANSGAKKESAGGAPKDPMKLPALSGKATESSYFCQYDTWRFCYYGITGNWNYWRNTYYMDSYITTYYGYPSVYHQLLRWNGSSWYYAIGQWVGPGNWGYVYVYGGNPYKKVETYGTGSRYNWAIIGH
jgi:hypothetical protein